MARLEYVVALLSLGVATHRNVRWNDRRGKGMRSEPKDGSDPVHVTWMG